MKKKYNILKNHPVTIKSKPVCCVADIPLQHVSYHANRYGKIAIGFHRGSVLRSGFNPVMYTLEDTELLNSIYQGYAAVDYVDPSDAISEAETIEAEINKVIDSNDLDDSVDSYSLDLELNWINKGYEKVCASFENILAYIKTFDESEFDSIYCEREWRSTESYNFSTADVAIIVLPREQEGERFYERFLDEVTLPKTVTVACWEDLIEH